MCSLQGEIIDRIEHNVESAEQHVRKGKDEVKQAAKLKSSVNRVSHLCFNVIGF